MPFWLIPFIFTTQCDPVLFTHPSLLLLAPMTSISLSSMKHLLSTFHMSCLHVSCIWVLLEALYLLASIVPYLWPLLPCLLQDNSLSRIVQDLLQALVPLTLLTPLCNSYIWYTIQNTLQIQANFSSYLIGISSCIFWRWFRSGYVNLNLRFSSSNLVLF